MKKTSKFKRIFGIIVYTSLILLLLFASAIIIYIHNTVKSVKKLDISLTNTALNYSEFYDNNNNLESCFDNIEKNYVDISDLNKDTINAFISIEDKDFYKHNGLNYKRILKATYNNLKSMSFKEGASTITQQLVKNRFLSNEKTIDRKIKEAYLAIKLEKNESKDKILETYLNTIYFGNGAYGIYHASKVFFNKEPKDLTLSESCILAGSIKAPSLYSPINNIDNSIKRRDLILSEMYEDKYITIDQLISAQNESVNVNINNYNMASEIDLYNEFAIDEACKILNVSKNNIIYGGYKIYTYKDTTTQEILDNHIQNLENYHVNTHGNIADSLSIIINNDDYSVSAISGKSNYNLVNINRQPGSLVKPIFTYAPALEEKEVYPISQILDEKITIDDYSPNNVGNEFYGYVSVKDAISKSLNIPAVKLTETLGIDKCKSYAEKVGINFSKYDNGYALALGGMTNGVSLKEITDAYSVFTSGGNYSKSRFIKQISTADDAIIYTDKLTETKVYNTDTAYLMTNMLDYAVDHGTSKKLAKLPFDVAGKTGTVAVKNTNLNTDAYSLAYTSSHTMSVWLGNYTMNEEYNLEGSNNGGTYATKIILDTFSDMYKDNKPSNFIVPENIVSLDIDAKSLSEDHVVVLGYNIPERYKQTEIFSLSNLPKSHSTKYSNITPFEINIETNKNSCVISFNTFDYITYEIYRKQNGNNTLLHSVNNSNGIFEFVDTEIEVNKLCTYYVIAKSKFADTTFKTNEKSIKIIKDYNTLLDQNEITYDWLFA